MGAFKYVRLVVLSFPPLLISPNDVVDKLGEASRELTSTIFGKLAVWYGLGTPNIFADAFVFPKLDEALNGSRSSSGGMKFELLLAGLDMRSCGNGGTGGIIELRPVPGVDISPKLDLSPLQNDEFMNSLRGKTAESMRAIVVDFLL